MKPVSTFSDKIDFVLTDIDDTLTDEGQLGPKAYQALWNLADSGIKVIPVTGRPAGWCEMIARMWPVAGVVGENGGFYFRYHNKKMIRHFALPNSIQTENRKKLDLIEKQILADIPGAAIASDQFTRLMDLAIDFCEDIPALPKESIQNIVRIFQQHGATAKVSSIHVNGWFGTYDKLSTALTFLKKEFALTDEQVQSQALFAGDSPNDEPMWAFFKNSFAVKNIDEFWNDLTHKPQYVASLRGGDGFTEIANQVLNNNQLKRHESVY